MEVGTKGKTKQYLVFHPHKPFRYDLVREQDPYEYRHGDGKDLDEGPSWSGFFVDDVRNLAWWANE